MKEHMILEHVVGFLNNYDEYSQLLTSISKTKKDTIAVDDIENEYISIYGKKGSIDFMNNLVHEVPAFYEEDFDILTEIDVETYNKLMEDRYYDEDDEPIF
jgi:hypothetical protein